MNVFDWLSDMGDLPGRTTLVEVKFKAGRKEYFRNHENLELYTGDAVMVEMPSGYHLGTVSLQGELVRLQLVRKGIKDDQIRNILRLATDRDLEKQDQCLARDLPTLYRAREVVREMHLNMKLSDVEFQADGSKATFYYSSEERVDFRELIKRLAGEFRVRIEMKQISLRQEAGRIGGLGVCGRELCCSTWLTDFKNVTTAAARYQNLSLNPVKLSGQCGRLKCCLNYELETYMEALRDIPAVEKPLQLQKGDAFLQKTDIFRRLMWFSFKGEDTWQVVPIEQVRAIQEFNHKGILPPTLTELEERPAEEEAGPLNDDLDRMDKKYQSKSQRKKKKKKPVAGASPEGGTSAPAGSEPPQTEPRARGEKPAEAGDTRPASPEDRRNGSRRIADRRGSTERRESSRLPGQGRPAENKPQEKRNGDSRPNTPRMGQQSGNAESREGTGRSPETRNNNRRGGRNRGRGGETPGSEPRMPRPEQPQ